LPRQTRAAFSTEELASLRLETLSLIQFELHTVGKKVLDFFFFVKASKGVDVAVMNAGGIRTALTCASNMTTSCPAVVAKPWPITLGTGC
jgi:hypothetical protein